MSVELARRTICKQRKKQREFTALHGDPIKKNISNTVDFLCTDPYDIIYYLNLYEDGIFSNLKYKPSYRDKKELLPCGKLTVTLNNVNNYTFKNKCDKNEIFLLLNHRFRT